MRVIRWGLILFWVFAGSSFAQEAQPLVAPLAVDEGTPVVEQPKQVAGPSDLSQQGDRFVSLWAEVQEGLVADDLHRVQSSIEDLQELKLISGYLSLETYSSALLDYASARLKSGKIEEAAYLTRSAFLLSPDNLPVEIQAFPIVLALGMRSGYEQSLRLARAFLHSPEYILSSFVHLTYPILWAITLAMIVTLVSVVFSHAADLYRQFALRFPQRWRGVAIMALLPTLLLSPPFFGPLPCVAVWSLVIVWSLPRYKMLGILAGALLAVWGFLIPLRENVLAWLSDPGVQSMIRVSRGDYVPESRNRLISLAHRRADDGLVYFTLSQVFRGYRDLDGAYQALSRAEKWLPASPTLVAEHGMIAYLSKDFVKAEEKLEEAQELGLHSAALYFNLSRVKFDLMKTEESRDLHRDALRADPTATRLYEEREHYLTLRDGEILAEERPPWSWYMRSALTPIRGLEVRGEVLAQSLWMGLKPIPLSVLGVILLLFSLMVREGKVRSPYHYFPTYRASRLEELLVGLLPSGSWVKTGKPIVGLVMSCTLILASFPLVEWPGDSLLLFAAIPWARTGYLIGFVVLSILFYYLTFTVSRSNEDLC